MQAHESSPEILGIAHQQREFEAEFVEAILMGQVRVRVVRYHMPKATEEVGQKRFCTSSRIAFASFGRVAFVLVQQRFGRMRNNLS